MEGLREQEGEEDRAEGRGEVSLFVLSENAERERSESVSTPKDRLEKAAHGLVREAENVLDIAIEAHNGTVSNNQGEIGRGMLNDSLGRVKGFVEEIERIVK